MYPPIRQVPPHIVAERKHLPARPPEHAREDGEARRLQPVQAPRVHPARALAQLPVPRPGRQRPGLPVLDDVDEAGVPDHLAEPRRRARRAADGLGALQQERGPPGDGRAVQGAVVARDGEGVVLELDVAAGLEVAVWLRGFERQRWVCFAENNCKSRTFTHKPSLECPPSWRSTSSRA